MIVIDEPSGSLLLVRQPDHAKTCVQLANQWRQPIICDACVWEHFISAVGRHDDGWCNVEKMPAVDHTGRPVGFKSIATIEHVMVWQQSIELALRDDKYAALMIALHARWLYTHVSQNSDKDRRVAQAFVGNITSQIDGLLEVLSHGNLIPREAISPRSLAEMARLLGFFDALSLALLGAITWFVKSEKLVFGNQQDIVKVMRGDGTSKGQDIIYLKPWPFNMEQMVLSTHAIRLPMQRFDDSHVLAKCMANQQAFNLCWILRPS